MHVLKLIFFLINSQLARCLTTVTSLHKLNVSVIELLELRPYIQDQELYPYKWSPQEENFLRSELHKILHTFAYSHNCFVTIVNYNRVNIPLRFPLHIRTPTLALVLDQDNLKQNSWRPRPNLVWTLDATVRYKNWQQLSRYLEDENMQFEGGMGRYMKKSYRYQINALEYWLHSKQKKCMLEVSLDPPPIFSKGLHFPTTWKYSTKLWDTMPSSIPKIYMIWLRSIQQEEHGNVLKRWMFDNTFSNYKMGNCLFLRLIYDQNHYSRSSLKLLQPATACGSGSACKLIVEKSLSIAEFSQFHLLSSSPQPSPGRSTLFKSVDAGMGPYFDIFESIAGNISIAHSYSEDFDGFAVRLIKHVVPAPSVYSMKIPTLPVEMEDDTNNLVFVTCGFRGRSGFRVAPLVDIYQRKIWVYLGLILIMVSIFMTKISGVRPSLGQITDYVFSLVELMLDRGGPFRRRRFKESRLRCAIGGILLAGVVLTGSYKRNYSGLLRLIAPRLHLPYESFYELVHDHFSIYTTTGNMWPSSGYGGAIRLPHSMEILKAPTQENGYHINSEISMRLGTYKFNRYYSYSDRILSDFTNLHPSLPAIVKESITQLESEKWNTTPWMYDMLLFAKVKELEQQVLLDDLQACRRTAIIVSKRSAIEIATRMKKTKMIHVSIGYEEYFRNEIALTITGLGNPQLVKKMRASIEAGVWTAWSNIENSFHQKHLRLARRTWRNIVTSPSLQGNIFVVFVMLLIGALVGVGSFLVENLGRSLRKLWNILKSCYLGSFMPKRRPRKTENCNRRIDKVEGVRPEHDKKENNVEAGEYPDPKEISEMNSSV